jgi:uncharacterized protein (DUF2062 family)
MTKIALFERRIKLLRPQSYDIAVAIAVAIGMAAAYPMFG